MKWKKIGKIFDPTKHPSFEQYVGFAQSPQTIVFEDRIRIYFSIRKQDTNGKFISLISFVDFDKDLKHILNVASKPVMEPGKLGAFDEHGIFPINPLKVGDKLMAYTCGWSRRVSVSVETSTGLAVSNDNGISFNRVGDGPIMSASLREPFLVGDSFVKVFDNTFHMWYIYGTKWTHYFENMSAERVYKIGHATSDDGINFHREGRPIIADKINEDECQALPTVLKHNAIYHMIFCYRHALGFRTDKSKSYRLGYAFSHDLLNWKREDESTGINTTTGSWDSEMMCYPHLFECEGEVYLLYNGNEFGKYGFGLAVLEN